MAAGLPRRGALAVLLATTLLVPLAAGAQTPDPPASEPAPLLARGYRTRALAASVGHTWRFGWNDATLATTDALFVGFHPQLGWFQTARLELFGEGTIHLYARPHTAVFAGLMGIGARWHVFDDRPWTPYATVSAGLGWTNIDIVEIDRVFNFQVVWGGGLRQITRRGPGWMIEFRNHHISNAGTKAPNIGINSATLLLGLHWIVR